MDNGFRSLPRRDSAGRDGSGDRPPADTEEFADVDVAAGLDGMGLSDAVRTAFERR